ncbi:MAG: beta-lactamase [Bryobacterales bacterium]|nr:beta-lactamase [Bryobacterales bacterium]
MKHRLAVLAVFTLFSDTATLSQTPSIRRLDGSRITVAEAEAFARKTLADAHVTGAQIAVVDRGRLVWSSAFGLRRREPPLPMTTQTPTWLGSITKSVFSVYVMQLVERGELALDVPLASQLTKPLDAYEAWRESGSELVKDPRWPLVTPRMLLTHSSGLANLAMFEPDKKLHLHQQPGTSYRYSGDGLNLIQLFIEQKKGKTLDLLMDDAFFTPLGMKRSGIIYKKEFGDEVADRFGAEEQFLAKTRRFPAHAAGSMTSTADDLATFVSALFAGKLLKPATQKMMLQPSLKIRSVHQFSDRFDEPENSEVGRVGLAYGLGWGLLTKTPFGPAFFKEGHGDGAQTYMICFERRQACMIVLTNSDNGEFIFRALFEKILGDTVTPWEWEGYTPAAILESRKNQ